MGPSPYRLALVWLPLLLYAAVVFFFSTSSYPTWRLPVRLSDKLIHFVEYAILAALLMRALFSLRGMTRWWVGLLITILLVSAIGLVDELVQRSVPGRTADWKDWLADSMGGLTGSLAYLAARRLWLGKTVT